MSEEPDTFVQAHEAGHLLEAIARRLRGDWNNRDSLASELAALHNDGSIDLVAGFGQLRNNSESPDFFLTRHVFEAALRVLNAPVAAVMKCVLHLSHEAGHDMMAWSVIGGFEAFCAKDPCRPRDALIAIKADADAFAELLTAVITTGFETDNSFFLAEAIRLCSDANIQLRKQALYCLGRLKWSKGIMWPEDVIVALERAVEDENDNQLLAGVVKSAFELSRHDQDATKQDRAISLLVKAATKSGDLGIHAVSEIFCSNARNLLPKLVDAFLPLLLRVKASNKGTIEFIDVGLSSLLEADDAGKAIRFLEELLVTNAGELSLVGLETTSVTIRNKQALLSTLTTRWLLRGNRALCASIGTLFSGDYGDSIKVGVDTVALNGVGGIHLIFLARKVVGYLFSQPVSAVSILIDLMRIAPDGETFEGLRGLVLDPLLINYTGSVRDYVLKQLDAEGGKVKDALQKALEETDAYLDTLRSVGDLPALHPSQSQREAYHRDFARRVSKSAKAAEEKSVIMRLVSKSILLYGRVSIIHIDNGVGTPHRMETPLQDFRTEIELPRLLLIDPAGLDYMLRVFRNEQIRNEINH